MTMEERETVVRIGYGPDGQASIWSTERRIWGQCRRAGWKMVQESVTKRGSIVGQEWVSGADDLRLSVRKPGRPKVKTGFAVREQPARKTQTDSVNG